MDQPSDQPSGQPSGQPSLETRVSPLRCRACGVQIKPGESHCLRCGARVPIQDAIRVPHAASRRTDDDEEVLWEDTFSWKGMFREFAVAALLTVLAIFLYAQTDAADVRALIFPLLGIGWLGLFAVLIYRKLNVRYTLTNQRLIHRHGVLYRRTHRIEAIDFDDLRFEQGILEHVLNVGTVRIISSDASHRSLTLRGIGRPQEVYELMERSRRQERLKYGLHIESV